MNRLIIEISKVNLNFVKVLKCIKIPYGSLVKNAVSSHLGIFIIDLKS